MQETRHYAASTVSRRMSIVGGYYRTCVIDELLEHSPADYVRRPDVPPESPTLGPSHLQLEALLTDARTSTNTGDFALVCLLGLLGLRIFEACALDLTDLGEEHGHRVLRVVGKGHKLVLVPLPPAVARAVDRAVANRTDGPLLLNTVGRRCRHPAPTPARRPPHHHALRPRPHHPGPAPHQLHPRRLHGLRRLTPGVSCPRRSQPHPNPVPFWYEHPDRRPTLS